MEKPNRIKPKPKVKIEIYTPENRLNIPTKTRTTADKSRAAKTINTAKPETETTIDKTSKKIERRRIIGNQIGKKSIFRNNSNIFSLYLKIISTGRYSTVFSGFFSSIKSKRFLAANCPVSCRGCFAAIIEKSR